MGRVLKINAEATALVASGTVSNTPHLYKWNDTETRWDFVHLIEAPREVLSNNNNGNAPCSAFRWDDADEDLSTHIVLTDKDLEILQQIKDKNISSSTV